MRIKKFLYYLRFAPFIILLLSLSYGFKGDNKKGGSKLNKSVIHMNKTTSGKVGDGYRININNLDVPVNNKGIIAEVDLPDNGTTNGYYLGHEFLFSGGFFLSGTRNGSPWANAVAAATLVEDYVPGTVESGQTDPRAQLYVLNSQDQPFSQSWQDWKDAVDLGADFYDGDGDGQYNPVDLNGNGVWDPDEDAPDLLGDETVWCVYNDGLPASQRRWTTISPMGIEIRQTVFGFASAGAIGNLLFVRYRIKYVGLNKPDDPESLNDVYFGVWADPDVGEVDGYNHNLVGCDTTRNSGYTYLKDPSPQDWGNQPPCFMIDFFSGPLAYIPGITFIDNNGDGIYNTGDTPLDSAISVRGNVLGIKSYPGARNQPLSSFVEYINGDPVLNDPDNAIQARNLILGLSRTGEVVDPCNWSYGEVQSGTDCAQVDPRFWYSGDPVANTGWINTAPADIRQMSNTGPFILKKGEEQEIVVAYVVGQGNSPLNSITVTKQIDDGAQYIFDHNFVAPTPPPPVTAESQSALQVGSGEDFIDLIWDTAPQFNFVDSTDAYNDHFQGYKIYAYKSNTTAPTVNNESNRKLIATYTADNFIQDVYTTNATGGEEILYKQPDSTYQLDPDLYGSSNGRLRIRITEDPFTGTPLIKGKPYYFSIVGYALNWFALIYKDDPSQPLGTVGNYLIDPLAFVGNVENIEKIIPVTMGENLYTPPFPVQSSTHQEGYSDGEVGYDIVQPDNLKGDDYKITFMKDSSSASYKMFWKLTNTTTNSVLADSMDQYTLGSSVTAGQVYEGFIPRVKPLTTTIGTSSYEPSANIWYSDFDPTRGTGVYYVGKDIPQGGPITLTNNTLAQSDAIHADDLRRVELRFGENGKAYRYLNGFIPTTPIPSSKKSSYFYAPRITADDTVGNGEVGKLGEGFVDVPFTAWVVDERYDIPDKQLAVGFIEMSKDYGGQPDGIWNPTDSLLATSEVIVIFNADYDQNGGQIEYTGGNFNGTDVYADLIRGFTIPADAPGVTDQQRTIAKSKWFNAMYVVGLEKETPSTFYQNGDKLIIPMTTYPYTSADIFQFTTRSSDNLTDTEGKDLFKKVNVFPNPLYGFNPATSYTNIPSDEPFVTFSNLPRDITITIYSLSGNKLRTLTTDDKSSPSSPFLEWDLKNESGIRVASGLYLAIVDSPKYGQKILKFSIIMPQKQLQKY
jgi:hypothetical protein